MKHCDYMNADWFQSLKTEVDASSKAAVARKMQVDRSTLSAAMNGLGEYGKGKASTSGIELQFRRAYEQLKCPHTLKVIGIAECRSNALGAAPTHNPRQMMHWQACQSCPNKPPPLKAEVTKAKVKVKRRNTKIETVQVQQAGIIDTVTLPLPIVGGPQINEHTAQEAA